MEGGGWKSIAFSNRVFDYIGRLLGKNWVSQTLITFSHLQETEAAGAALLPLPRSGQTPG